MAKKNSSAKVKGDSLEEAVQTLEAAILRESPSYVEGTFQFEPKKIIMADGVRHEIDLWVTVDHGNGYTATFIFECKNWRKKIGKSHIIEFSEKVKVAPAQKGFFVAKSFTRYAEAQAKKDPRVELLCVEELDLTELPSFILAQLKLFHIVAVIGGDTRLRIYLKSDLDSEASFTGEIEFLIDGVPHPFEEHVSAFIQQTVHDTCKNFDSLNVADGETFPVNFEGVLRFNNHVCLINGEPLSHISTSGTVQVHVARPSAIESQFEIADRGRVYHVVSKSPYVPMKTIMPHSMMSMHLEQIHSDPTKEWTVSNAMRLFTWLAPKPQPRGLKT
jgi:hypothetical protein